MKNIGMFKIVSGNVTISDPCYSLCSINTGNLRRVKKGNWQAFVTHNKNGYVSKLITLHESIENNIKEIIKKIGITNIWREQYFDVGVDSGQAGIYDTVYYKDDSSVKGLKWFSKIIAKEVFDGLWYSYNYDRTLSKEGAGVIPYGAVSGYGYGDGTYTCYTFKKNKEIIGIIINFE